MNLQSAYRCWLGAMLVSSLVLWAPPSARAQKILLHGANVDASFGADAAVLTHLQSLFGADNVTYMQGDMAAADGSSAAGFDAVIISSTLGSGTIRNKYEDASIGVMNWEQALTRQMAGEFNLSASGQTQTALTEIEILDANHPIAMGVPAGPVTVFSTPHTMSFGLDALGAGVVRVAKGPDDNDHAILAAEAGAPLLGDGSPGSPATAPARRVMFFLEDQGFVDLTPAGIQLFNNAVNFVANVLEPIVPGDFNGDGEVTEADFTILSNNLGGHLDGPVGRSEGDMNFDGKIDLADFGEFKAIFPGAVGQAQAIPEPGTMGLFAGLLAMLLAGPLWRRVCHMSHR